MVYTNLGGIWERSWRKPHIWFQCLREQGMGMNLEKLFSLKRWRLALCHFLPPLNASVKLPWPLHSTKLSLSTNLFFYSNRHSIRKKVGKVKEKSLWKISSIRGLKIFKEIFPFLVKLRTVLWWFRHFL